MKNNTKIKAIYTFWVISFFLILLLICGANKSFAGLPPTTLKGAKDPTNPVTFFFQAPNNMAAHSGSTGYVSQVQKNWLIDPDFMDSDLTKWSYSTSVTAKSNDKSIYVNNNQSRKVTFTATGLGGQDYLIYQDYTPNQDYSGINFEASMQFMSTNSAFQYALCAGTQSQVNSARSASDLFTASSYYPQCVIIPVAANTWQTAKTFFPNMVSGTTYMIALIAHVESAATDNVYVSTSYFGPQVSLSYGTPPNTFTATISSTGVISNQTPSGTTWLSSCTASSGNITCTPTSGFFTSAPNCNPSPNTAGGSGYSVGYVVASATANSLPFALTSGGSTSNAFGIIVSCTKTGSDYVQPAITPDTPYAPTVTRLTSGSGTYTVPIGVKYIVVEMVGGGGGGAGSGSGGSAAGAGGSTTFGTSLLTATGGGAGTYNAGGYGGAAGSTTINSPAILIANPTSEAGGGNWCNYGASLNYVPSGKGGSTFFAGGGASATNSAGYWASANTGGGGSGGAGSGTASTCTGGGGGGGGYLKAQINNPSSSYTYSIGAGGTAGGAGTNGYAGGAGGSGVIIVHEYYSTQNVPLLLGSVTSKFFGSLSLEGANLNNTNGSSAVNSSTSSWISTNSCAGNGACIYNVTGFSSAFNPFCTCSANAGSASQCAVFNISPTSITIGTWGTTGSQVNENNVKVICLGPRGN